DPATLAAAAAVGGSEEIEQTELADVGLDDEVADPFEELIEAGDEAQDQVEPSADSRAESPPVPAIAPADSAAERSLTEPSPDESEPSALPGMGEVRRL